MHFRSPSKLATNYEELEVRVDGWLRRTVPRCSTPLFRLTATGNSRLAQLTYPRAGVPLPSCAVSDYSPKHSSETGAFRGPVGGRGRVVVSRPGRFPSVLRARRRSSRPTRSRPCELSRSPVQVQRRPTAFGFRLYQNRSNSGWAHGPQVRKDCGAAKADDAPLRPGPRKGSTLAPCVPPTNGAGRRSPAARAEWPPLAPPPALPSVSRFQPTRSACARAPLREREGGEVLATARRSPPSAVGATLAALFFRREDRRPDARALGFQKRRRASRRSPWRWGFAPPACSRLKTKRLPDRELALAEDT